MNNICFICDEEYELPTKVAISSLKRHIDKSTGQKYVCHVVSFGLSDETVAAFSALSEPEFIVQVRIVDIEPYQHRLNKVTQKTHVTKSALLKFELPNIFPNCDKLLYLDSDVIIRDDISSIFSLDVSEKYLAAVVDYWGYYDCIRYRFGKIRESAYFNAGFLLYNIPKMLKDHISERLWEKKNVSQTPLMDQECLNKVIGQNCYQLPLRYNFNPMFLGSFNVPHFNRIYNTNYKSMQDVVDDMAVIHYMCHGAKPWLYTDVALGEYWINEYVQMGDNAEPLELKKPSWKIKPEFCKGFRDVWQGKFRLVRLISYCFCIIIHWKYYRTLFK